MQNSNLYFTLFRKISEHLTILLNIQAKKKAGRSPNVSDLQLAALYITSYISINLQKDFLKRLNIKKRKISKEIDQESTKMNLYTLSNNRKS
jgi:hypothetical protein